MKRSIIMLLVIVFTLPLSLNAATVYTSMDTANSVLKSLKTEPDNWFHDSYRLYYFKDKERSKATPARYWDTNADCVIWIANGAFAIKVEYPQRVIFHEKTQKIIWDIYQQWANGHFAKTFGHLEAFEHLSGSEVVEEKIVETSTSEFQPLTSQTKSEKKANDFYSSIPKWFLTAAAVITVLAIIGMLISLFIKKRKGESYA